MSKCNIYGVHSGLKFSDSYDMHKKRVISSVDKGHTVEAELVVCNRERLVEDNIHNGHFSRDLGSQVISLNLMGDWCKWCLAACTS